MNAADENDRSGSALVWGCLLYIAVGIFLGGMVAGAVVMTLCELVAK